MSMIGNFVALPEAKLRELIDDPTIVTEILYPDDGESEPPNHLDIDKAWQGIHFLLTGDAWGGVGALSMAIMGGTEIGEDVGYGPARYLTASQVADVAAALAKVSRQELADKFSSNAFNQAEIYPQIWDEEEETVEYLLSYFDDVVTFYREAAARNDAALLYID